LDIPDEGASSPRTLKKKSFLFIKKKRANDNVLEIIQLNLVVAWAKPEIALYFVSSE